MRIGAPKYDILRRAAENAALRLNGKLSTARRLIVRDRIEVFPFVIEARDGILAISVEDGELKLHWYGFAPTSMLDASSILTEEYTRIALEEAGRSSGYSVSTRRVDGGYILEFSRGGGVIRASVGKGSLSIDADGFEGEACERAVKAITDRLPSLGSELTEERKKLKREYFQVSVSGSRLTSTTNRIAKLLTGFGVELRLFWSSPCG